MPVRRIPKNFIHITGIVASYKSIGPAEFEGGLEYDHVLIREFDQQTATFEVQPVRIPYRDHSGKLRYYTLDLRAEHIDNRVKPLLCETKPRAVLRKDWAEFKPKFRAAIRHANQEDSRFKIVTDKEIRTQYLTSARFFLPFRRRGGNPALESVLLDAMATMVEATPRKLLNKITEDEWKQAKMMPVLWYLIATFQVSADLDQVLTMDMRISLP